jgi:hypothetical protein
VLFQVQLARFHLDAPPTEKVLPHRTLAHDDGH